MYHKTHHGNLIGTIELTAQEVQTLIKILGVIISNPDNKLNDEHILWNRTFFDLKSNLLELEKELVK